MWCVCRSTDRGRSLRHSCFLDSMLMTPIVAGAIVIPSYKYSRVVWAAHKVTS